MALTLINSIVTWVLKKRIHQMELFMKFPIDVQNELLLSLVNQAQNTEFGKKHGFSSIKKYAQYF